MRLCRSTVTVTLPLRFTTLVTRCSAGWLVLRFTFVPHVDSLPPFRCCVLGFSCGCVTLPVVTRLFVAGSAVVYHCTRLPHVYARLLRGLQFSTFGYRVYVYGYGSARLRYTPTPFAVRYTRLRSLHTGCRCLVVCRLPAVGYLCGSPLVTRLRLRLRYVARVAVAVTLVYSSVTPVTFTFVHVTRVYVALCGCYVTVAGWIVIHTVHTTLQLHLRGWLRYVLRLRFGYRLRLRWLPFTHGWLRTRLPHVPVYVTFAGYRLRLRCYGWFARLVAGLRLRLLFAFAFTPVTGCVLGYGYVHALRLFTVCLRVSHLHLHLFIYICCYLFIYLHFILFVIYLFGIYLFILLYPIYLHFICCYLYI